ncbi:MAG: ABC transporter permease, partial [Oscillospiraceae bacterium]
MSAFLYGVALQWKMDIRSRSLLITCYAVPLVFFVFMGGVFTSINPQAKDTLIQSMTVMGVSMGAFIGLPPSLVELYASEKRKIYRANGVPLSLGAVTTCLSAMIHLLLMAGILCAAAPILFDAALPTNLTGYFCSLA